MAQEFLRGMAVIVTLFSLLALITVLSLVV